MILRNVKNESNHTKIYFTNYIDTKTILWNVTYLQQTYGPISPLHSVYLNIIKDIQTSLLEQLKNNQFDEPYFIASTTANFVCEIMNDFQCPSKNHINKLIAEFQLQNPKCDKQILSSNLGMRMFYNFFVNQMSNLEDNLRSVAMVKAGKTYFTSNDKNQIVLTLTSVIYRHSQNMTFPNNVIGILIGNLIKKLIRLGIEKIALKHINKSISLSNALALH